MDEMNYIVTTVEPDDDFTMVVGFVDGKRKRFDMKPIISRGGVFEKLKDINFFKKAHVDRDTVVWDEIIDIAPESLYERGVAI